MRLAMASSLGLASLALAALPPLPSASSSAFSFLGDMPGVYFDGEETQPRTYTQEEVDAINAELTRTKTERDGYKTTIDTAETAKLDEKEKAEKRATDAEAKVTAAQERVIKAEIKAAAAAAGGKDAEIITMAIRGQVKVSDDGEVDAASLKATIEQLVKDKPYLFGEEGGGGNGGGGASNPNRQRGGGTLTQADLKKMTAAQIAALTPAQVAEAMSRQ